MTHITEVIDLQQLDREVLAGNVVVRKHPEHGNLLIANYTDQCAFSRSWNDVTRQCRGLIWNDHTGEVLARPFPKFFNWDEKEAPRILDDQVVWHWADKADGSLGIMYRAPSGEPRIATRGSFQSEQAKLGTKLLHGYFSPDYDMFVSMMNEGYTPLFEIVGPSNRIVLSYAEDALVPLGYIHIGSGEFVPPAGAERRTMRDLLGDLSRSNAEGWVVWLSNRQALKIKQADYIELHRMVSNLTPKEVWRQLRAGTYHDYIERMPDELQELGEGWADALRADFSSHWASATQDLEMLTREDGANETRKDQAAWITRNVAAQFRGLVFGLLDGKDITDAIWRMLEPSGLDRG